MNNSPMADEMEVEAVLAAKVHHTTLGQWLARTSIGADGARDIVRAALEAVRALRPAEERVAWYVSAPYASPIIDAKVAEADHQSKFTRGLGLHDDSEPILAGLTIVIRDGGLPDSCRRVARAAYDALRATPTKEQGRG